MKLPRFFGRLKRPEFTRSWRRPLMVRRITGESMSPALTTGRLILASSLSRPRPGQVVVLRHNGLEKIKRLQQIGQDHVFVCGDNPAASTDSRHFGWLNNNAVVATVLWPRCNKSGSSDNKITTISKA